MANANVHEFTDANFQAEVLDSDLPVLVDFWATWCAPCRAIAPIVDDVASELDGKLKVGKVNTEQHQQTAASLRVTAIPALFVFKGGREVDRIIGAVNKATLMQRLTPHLD